MLDEGCSISGPREVIRPLPGLDASLSSPLGPLGLVPAITVDFVVEFNWMSVDFFLLMNIHSEASKVRSYDYYFFLIQSLKQNLCAIAIHRFVVLLDMYD